VSSLVRQLARHDFASLLVDTQMELAIVPALWWFTQLANVHCETAAVDQDVQRHLRLILVEENLTQLLLAPQDRGVIGHLIVQLQQSEQRTQHSFGLPR